IGAVLPAVVEATEIVALDPTGGELRAPMRTAKRDEMGPSTLTSVQGELLTHYLDGLGPGGQQGVAAIDGLPEAAQIAAGQRAGSGVREIRPIVFAVRARLALARHAPSGLEQMWFASSPLHYLKAGITSSASSFKLRCTASRGSRPSGFSSAVNPVS